MLRALIARCRPPRSDTALPRLDEAERRRLTAARQETRNFLHYCGDPQPPIDPYVTAHHAVQK